MPLLTTVATGSAVDSLIIGVNSVSCLGLGRQHRVPYLGFGAKCDREDEDFEESPPF